MNNIIAIVTWISAYWKDLVGVALALSIIGIPTGLLLFARHLTIRQHREQFKATGGEEFALPSARDFEREEPVARPGAQEPEAKTFPMDAATSTIAQRAQEIRERTIVSTETGELVRLGADGLPLSPADIAARTAPTTFTVDSERLAEILTLEETGEYAISPATWAEIGAAEAFMADPLGSAVLPPLPLTEEAGNPSLATTFYALVGAGGLTTDWSDEDSDFDKWYRELRLSEPLALAGGAM
jgi:hypothetical protein